MNLEKLLNVKNRSSSVVVYKIPETNLRREFQPGETKRVSFGELEKLTYQPGGRELLEHFLLVEEEEVTNNFNIHREPEYDLTEDQIVELLKSGSREQFLDALDFAPVGVIDLIKELSVSLPLMDLNKRKDLKDKTGFDVEKALIHIEEEKIAAEEPVAPVAATTRRTNVNYKKTANKPAAKETSTEGSKYNIVS